MADQAGNTGHDVIDVLARDHREIEDMLHELRDAWQDNVAGVLMALLVRHATVEQEYVYPVLRDQVPEGEQLANQGLAQHVELEGTLHHLQALQARNPDADRLLGELAREVRHHVEYDTVELFPRLRAALTRSHLAWLGERLSGFVLDPSDKSRQGDFSSSASALLEQVKGVLARRLVRRDL